MNQTRRPRGSSISRALLSFATVTLLFCALAVAPPPARADDAAARRAAAQGQFARAEALRAQLEAKTERERSINDYKQLISAYRRVYLITPHAAEVPTALKEVGDLYRKMGEQFEASYFDSAVESYEFLLHEYPTSVYREDAQLAIAAIQRNNLGQTNLAQKGYRDFLSQYPHSPRADEARAALAEIDAADKLDTRDQTPAPPDAARPASSSKSADTSEVTQIRVWNADTYTRIIIPLGGQAKYQAARISDPDRIYFDIEGAKLSPKLLNQPIDVPSGGYLKTARVAQNRSNIVRVVLEVTQVKDYSVFELANPDRLVVDVYGPAGNTAATASANVGKNSDATLRTVSGKREESQAVPVNSPPARKATKNSGAALVANAASHAPDFVPDLSAVAPAPSSAAAARSVPPSREAATPTPTAMESAPSVSLKKAAEAMGPPPVPEITHAGNRSLTRALGLKIGRIVIDAGHGGRDTGTIGPSGLMEKDLCLDLALRLGKLIDERLPGAQVVYTRADDTFVPLEERTALANSSKADLFLSIHANSSDDRKVSGIETYYLNFNASPGAMQVAARENAVGQAGVHDLQDMVQKIARNEKIEESRDFATDIQDSLAKQAERVAGAERNRGVRKAPFVVLIGADMPSVLAEVSFLSNPADEQWLKKPENRQRIAEGLYHGIESYLHSTNSLTADTASPAAERPMAVARSGNQ
jgi:N-acetylmuramoyl-L-alanine amidase